MHRSGARWTNEFENNFFLNLRKLGENDLKLIPHDPTKYVLLSISFCSKNIRHGIETEGIVWKKKTKKQQMVVRRSLGDKIKTLYIVYE